LLLHLLLLLPILFSFYSFCSFGCYSFNPSLALLLLLRSSIFYSFCYFFLLLPFQLLLLPLLAFL
jgi:hypothetical protein